MRPRQYRFRGRCAIGDAVTFDQELLNDGLWLSLIGMGVVFSVLSLLAISIKVFDRVDSLIPEASTAGVSAPAVSEPTPPQAVAEPSAVSENEDALTAAAIAVALALAEADRNQSSGSSPVAGAMSSSSTNTWLAAGRTREMSNRFTGQAFGARNRR